MLPRPAALDPRVWRLLAIFVGTITALVAQPLPMGSVAVIGLATALVTRTLTIGEALTGFSNSVVWLVVVAFLIAHSVTATGLGRRLAYRLMALAGRRTIGLGYSLIVTDLALAPVVPSTTARAGGAVFPLLRSLAVTAFGPPDSAEARRTSGFLTLVAYHGTVVTSGMFLTAMAPNPLMVDLARQQGVAVTWLMWAAAASVPGLLSLAIMPLVIYRLCPPAVRETPDAAAVARTELARMGAVTRREWITLTVIVALLGAWIFGTTLNLDNTAAAIAAIALLLLTGVLRWDDVAQHHEAWTTFVWFSVLIMMATVLGQLGFTKWFSGSVSTAVAGSGWVTGFLVLSLVYFFSHYLFASVTAHVSAMFAPFLAVALAMGTPPLLATFVLAYFSAIFASLTHYGTAPGPILFGAGYVSLRTWWTVGAVIGALNIVIWLGLGGLWWRVLGYW